MRYFDLTLTPEDGAIHPVDRAIAAHVEVGREAIMHFDALGDGSAILLYRLRGDAPALIEALSDHPDLYAHDLMDGIQPLVSLAEKYALIIETPIEFIHSNAVRMTVIGDHDMLRAAIEEMPDSLSITIDQVGTYSPDRRDTLSSLTDRQLEVFRTAVELGYYEIPRRATHEEIADSLECAPSTVDEHLRKAESRVLQSLVG
ncbi:DNA-binding protein [Halobacteriales archaeon QH_7_69_31]|nr:MAG: DNA-binding protein [Halobacteriales archaeon QH_7_69_31]